MNSLLQKAKQLPETPGVYFMKDAEGKIIYVGKASNLRRRVSSYFERPHDARIELLVKEIRVIDFWETASVLEALILEANEIHRLKPKYNILGRDDKSFIYLVFTREKFPRPELVRGHELERLGSKHYRSVFGPYLSAASVLAALKILRKIFPYSTCEPPASVIARNEETKQSHHKEIATRPSVARDDKSVRPCFYYHLKLCPGVCVGEVSARDYLKTIRQLEMVFAGKKEKLIREMRRDMNTAAKNHQFEVAAKFRNQIHFFDHIQDVAMLKREEREFFGPPSPYPSHRGRGKLLPLDGGGEGEGAINIFGRIEGYDISNINGNEAVGSMVVFEEGEPKKSEYRKFRIKSVKGANDVAMMKEVLRRRFSHLPNTKLSTKYYVLRTWPKPDLIIIDGGWGQVNAAREILRERQLNIPTIGIAKGFNRKQDRPIFEKDNHELERLTHQYKNILLSVRDEAHRFAISFHRLRMRKRLRK